MDKLTAIKIKQADGTYSDQILIGVTASNVVYDTTHSITDIVDELKDSIRTLHGIGDNLLFDTYTKGKAIYSTWGSPYISDTTHTGTTYTWIDATDLPDPSATCYLHFSADSGTEARAYAFYGDAPPVIQSGEYYRIGCYAKSTTGDGHLRLRFSSNTGTIKDFTVTSEWKWYEYTTKFIDSGNTGATYKRTYFYFRPETEGETLDMCGFRLNRVTDIQSANIINDNLLFRTKDFAGWSRYSGVTLEKDPDEDVNRFHYPAVETVAYRDVTFNQPGISIPYSLVRNQTVTLSFWVKVATPSVGIVNAIHTVFSLTDSPGSSRKRYSGKQDPAYVLTETSEWQRVVFTTQIKDSMFTTGTTEITDDLYFFIQFYNHSASESWMKKPKLEFGGIATEWCQNKNDNLWNGGRNLLKGSKLDISDSTTFNIAKVYFGDEAPVEGESYVLQIKGELGTDRTGWGVYNSGGTVYEANYNSDNKGTSPAFYDSSTGIYTIPIPSWKIVQGSTTATNEQIYIYQIPRDGVTSSSIEWVKLEKGTMPSGWTFAPEDLAQKTTGNPLELSTLNIDNFPANNIFGNIWLNCSASEMSGDLPDSGGQGILMTFEQSANYCRQYYVGVTNGGASISKSRLYYYSTETWSAWADAKIATKINSISEWTDISGAITWNTTYVTRNATKLYYNAISGLIHISGDLTVNIPQGNTTIGTISSTYKSKVYYNALSCTYHISNDFSRIIYGTIAGYTNINIRSDQAFQGTIMLSGTYLIGS